MIKTLFWVINKRFFEKELPHRPKEQLVQKILAQIFSPIT
jgi:hypothetical protein